MSILNKIFPRQYADIHEYHIPIGLKKISPRWHEKMTKRCDAVKDIAEPCTVKGEHLDINLGDRCIVGEAWGFPYHVPCSECSRLSMQLYKQPYHDAGRTLETYFEEEDKTHFEKNLQEFVEHYEKEHGDRIND